MTTLSRPQSFRMIYFAAISMCCCLGSVDAQRLLTESFENFDSNNKPIGWETAGHPSYLRVANESGNSWSTPFGEHAMSTYSTGIGTKIVGIIPFGIEDDADGDYTVRFHVSSNAAFGEYLAELWVYDSYETRWMMVASKSGITGGSKDFSYTDEFTWRYNYSDWLDPILGFSTVEGQQIRIRLRQDPNRTNWRHTPLWDNVTVDYIPDIDTVPPTVDEFTNDNEGVEVVATGSVVTYSVFFSEAMNPDTVNVSDFGNAGASSVTIQSVTPNSDNTVFDVEVVPTNPGTLRLRIVEGSVLEDVAGNAMNTSGPLIQDEVTFLVEAGIPTILPSDFVDDRNGGPIAADTLVSYTLTFSKGMNASTIVAADFGNAGTAPITIGTITELSPTVYTVEITPTGSGTLQLRINQGVNIRAADGGILNTTSAIADDTVFIVDSDPPLFEEFQNDSVANFILLGTKITYDIFFNKAIDPSTVLLTDFGNAVSEGAAPFTIDSIELASPAVFRLEITPTATGSIQLQINAGAVIEDLVGNALNTTSAIVDDVTIAVTDGEDDPFDEWSGGIGFNGDTNGDGIPNGLAWFLGAADPADNALDTLPEAIMEKGKLVLAFYCLKPIDRGDAVFKVQFSSDLGQTALWTANEAVIPGVSGPVGNIAFDIQEAGELIYVEARMDVASGKMFGRIIGSAEAP